MKRKSFKNQLTSTKTGKGKRAKLSEGDNNNNNNNNNLITYIAHIPWRNDQMRFESK